MVLSEYEYNNDLMDNEFDISIEGKLYYSPKHNYNGKTVFK